MGYPGELVIGKFFFFNNLVPGGSEGDRETEVN